MFFDTSLGNTLSMNNYIAFTSSISFAYLLMTLKVVSFSVKELHF